MTYRDRRDGRCGRRAGRVRERGRPAPPLPCRADVRLGRQL